jgi:hypothetical protein
VKGKIQVSMETAKLLELEGKGNCLVPRENKVFVKGKGEMETFWLSMTYFQSYSRARTKTNSTSSSVSEEVESTRTNEQVQVISSGKMSRLVGWTSDVLLGMLTQIVAHRSGTQTTLNEKTADELKLLDPNKRTLEEVEEVITLPIYNAGSAMKQKISNPLS